VIDTQQKKRIGDIETGKGPVRVAVTPDGSTLIYALQKDEAVGFANTKTLKEETKIPLSGQPVSMTLSADKKMAFSSVQSQDKVFVISIAERKVKDVIETQPGAGPDPFQPLK